MLPGVGMFGTSLTARVIIPLLKDEGFAVKALWGRTQEEAEELAKEMSVPFYTSRIDEVLLHQDVDLVCINLPPPLTRQIAVQTLGERPLPTSPQPLLAFPPPLLFSPSPLLHPGSLHGTYGAPGDPRSHIPLGSFASVIPGLPQTYASLLPSGTARARFPTCVARRLEEARVPGKSIRRRKCLGLGMSRSQEDKTKSPAVCVAPECVCVCVCVCACAPARGGCAPRNA